MCKCSWIKLVSIISILIVIKAACISAQDTSSLPNVTFPDWYFPSFTDANNSRLITNISCQNTEIVVDLTFDEPFWGLVKLERSRGIPSCQLKGNGSVHFVLRVPLRDCGTTRSVTESAYEHANAMTVMFDRSHLLEAGDQRKVLICRYAIPPPPAFLEIKPEPSSDATKSSGDTNRWWPCRKPVLPILLMLSLWVCKL